MQTMTLAEKAVVRRILRVDATISDFITHQAGNLLRGLFQPYFPEEQRAIWSVIVLFLSVIPLLVLFEGSFDVTFFVVYLLVWIFLLKLFTFMSNQFKPISR